jgi:hypothetical protein
VYSCHDGEPNFTTITVKGTNYSDFPTAFLGLNIGPSPNVKKALFFPISWGEIHNSMVIKLFVKIANESFFK